MKQFLVISLVAAVALTTGCESQNSAQQPGRAEQREMARRAAAREQGTPDESQQNLMRAQQNVINRDGNASHSVSGGY
jgi:hypothetical protein